MIVKVLCLTQYMLLFGVDTEAEFGKYRLKQPTRDLKNGCQNYAQKNKWSNFFTAVHEMKKSKCINISDLLVFQI